MMNRLHLYIFSLLLVCAGVASCGSDGGKTASGQPQTDELFRDLTQVYISYTDSLGRIVCRADSDSVARAEAVSLIGRFEQQLYRTYRRYPADLDMALNETQNDSLWHLTQRFINVRRRVSMPALPPDTLAAAPSDTVSSVTDVKN